MHWLLAKGYSNVAAGRPDLSAVPVTATRSLCSCRQAFLAGIGALMVTTAAAWLEWHGMRVLLGRAVLRVIGKTWLTLAALA